MAAPTPGMLFVTMQPHPNLPLDQFHEWYNNEHGPTRLRIPSIFTNGLRFRASDSAEPSYLAVYDVPDMHLLTTPTYTDLRANRSPREAATISQVDVTRYFLDLASTRQSALFSPLEGQSHNEAEGVVLIAVEMTLRDEEGAEAAYVKWFEEEHVDMLAKVPGWLRTRRFRTSSLEGGAKVKHISLHEYARVNGLGGPEHKASMETKWREEVFAQFVANKARRAYELFYIFSPAPRELASLSRLPAEAAFTAADGTLSTTPGSAAAITSAITTPDGLRVPYRLEGNPSPTAPTIAFSNSLLTSLHMWDPLISLLRAARPDLRILRYDTRGRHAVPQPPVPATLDMLADDLVALLGALRIPRLRALVGVSMGGATSMKFALRHPGLVLKFVACDFNVASSAANTAAWKERIGVAESAGEDGVPGMRTLAVATVERWFHPHTMENKSDVAKWIVDMVAENSVEGFAYSCQALWNYDMKTALRDCRVPGLLVVGEGDGKGALVKAMDGFKGLLGDDGVDLKTVPLAGHLPMCESPQEFWDCIAGFV